MGSAAVNMRPWREQRDLIGQAAKMLGRSQSDFKLTATCQKAWLVRLHAPPASNPRIECPIACRTPWARIH